MQQLKNRRQIYRERRRNIAHGNLSNKKAKEFSSVLNYKEILFIYFFKHHENTNTEWHKYESGHGGEHSDYSSKDFTL